MFWNTASISCWLSCLVMVLWSAKIVEKALSRDRRLGGEGGGLGGSELGQLGCGLRHVDVADAADLGLQIDDLARSGGLLRRDGIFRAPVIGKLLVHPGRGRSKRSQSRVDTHSVVRLESVNQRLEGAKGAVGRWRGRGAARG